MGDLIHMQQSGSQPQVDHAHVGGDDDDDRCRLGCHHTIASAHETEIITGSDALRFLCSNSGISKQSSAVLKSRRFSMLFPEMSAREATSIELMPLPLISVTGASSRKQRKAYRPSRIPPLEDIEPLPPRKDQDVVLDLHQLASSKRSHAHGKGKQKGISDSSNSNSKHELLAKGKVNKRQDLSQSEYSSLVCKNLACKAVLRAGASFCRRCSCCMCKKFDDNKDPSLWIACDSDEEGCGLSCHVECALQCGVAGVIKKRGSISLDGSFACRSCGKITSLIGLWRRQLRIAKGARRVDVLCHRLSLSHRLLTGTLRFKDVHTPVDSAVKKLEAEVCLMQKGSAKLERCIVNRLSCNAEVQEMISLALERAESLGDAQSVVLDAHDAATCEMAFCTMRFEDVCPSSIIVVAVDSTFSDSILGYKLWHRKTTDPCYPATPTYTIHNTSKKVLVSDLQSCTSYVFKMAPFSSQGDGEECEAECCTEGIDSTVVEKDEDEVIIDCALRGGDKNHGGISVVNNLQHHKSRKLPCTQNSCPDRHGRRPIDDLSSAKALRRAEVDEGQGDYCLRDPGDAHARNCIASERSMPSATDAICNGMTSSRELEQGIEELYVPTDALDSSPLSLAKVVNVDVPAISNADSQSWALQVHCYGAQRDVLTKGVAIDVRDGYSHGSRCNADFHSLGFSIRVVRWLECQGHIDKEFRMKFLTWYSLRATEHERRVVSMFMNTLGSNPASLAAQLVDAFEEIVNAKRQRSATESGYYRRPYQ